jgi:hypothetical protein
MTVPPTRDELLELAELDALGALEPADQARFERGLRDASPALRAELHAIQDVAVLGPDALCDEEPEASLKYRVMARVANAVAESEAELAPIASIGRPAQVQRASVPGATGASSTPASPGTAAIVAAPAPSSRDAEVLQRVTLATEQSETERLRSVLDRMRVKGYVLRAACIALASCLGVSGYALVRQASFGERVVLAAISSSSREDLKALLGPTIEPFLRDGVPSAALAGTAPSSIGGVIVWYDPATGNAFIVTAGVDGSRTFEVSAIDPSADATEDAARTVLVPDLMSHGPLSGRLLQSVPDLRGRVIEIRDPNTGAVLYRGQLR